MAEETSTLHRGLREVYIDRTTSSYIDGKAGKLWYRGYSIDDLATNCTFEEVIYLLLYGELPTQSELDAFVQELSDNMTLPDAIIDIIRITKDAHPMDVLRTSISALATFDPEVNDNSAEATLRKGTRLTAQAPTIVTTHARIRNGQDPISPNPDLSLAGNFLYMLFGEIPDPEDTKLIDKDFVLHAEHGMNASSFGARVSASTQADLQ